MHELLFGFVPAIVAGFLLTSSPNWTGRLPIVGQPLILLVAIWLLGRVAMAGSALLPVWATAIVAVGFLATLAGLMAHEIIAGRNWRNLKVVAVLALLALTQIWFHVEIAFDGTPLIAHRAAIALIIVLVLIIGGRVVPSFTRNWLNRQGKPLAPLAFGTLDKAAMVVGSVGLAGWAILPLVAPAGPAIALFLALGGMLGLARQWRWSPLRVWAEPLVAILHLAFLFISLGLLLAALSSAMPADTGLGAAAIHSFTAGAMGTMIMAMMTRVSLGHTGQPLAASTSTRLIYAAVLLAALARILAALVPAAYQPLLWVAIIAWGLAFGGFALTYGPLLLRDRRA